MSNKIKETIEVSLKIALILSLIYCSISFGRRMNSNLRWEITESLELVEDMKDSSENLLIEVDEMVESLRDLHDSEVNQIIMEHMIWE